MSRERDPDLGVLLDIVFWLNSACTSAGALFTFPSPRSFFVTMWLKPWSPRQLNATSEAVDAAGVGVASGVEGPQAPKSFEDFALGKRSKDASIMCHFNQKNTTNSME